MKFKEDNLERTGKDRWLVSYADFITLLFAFFVVMYAISSINSAKYREFVKSLEQVFPDRVENIKQLDLNKLLKIMPFIVAKHHDGEDNLTKKLDSNGDFQDIELVLKLKKQLNSLVVKQNIQFRESTDWLEIEVGTNILFNTGSSFLNNDAELMLKQLATLLSHSKNTITIEGFTDNVPIHNTVYPSNWVLSADRAATVASAFIRAGIEPQRLAVVGYGENFPRANNDSELGRQQNRRIIIVVEKNNKRKQYLATNNTIAE